MTKQLAEQLLELTNVSAGYAGEDVVHDVSMTVQKGEVLALLGPNGGGKTTLLKATCGAVDLSKGSICIDGLNLSTLSFRQRAKLMGYVPQSEDHVFDFTVEEVVLMGRLAHSDVLFETEEDFRVAHRVMGDTDCLEFSDRPLATLSGGEAQRALIARALAQEAPLLLCDEPTTHLDPKHQVHIGSLLRRLAESGKAVIVTTHDLNWALQFADRAVLLDKGRVCFDGGVNNAVETGVHTTVYGTNFETLRSDGRIFVAPTSIVG